MKIEATKEESFMRNTLLVIPILFMILLAGCSSGKKKQTPVSLQDQPKSSSQGYFARERERKRRYEKEFRDTSRPMNQDHFRVMPWEGKHYSPRSESLHESSSDSLFRF